jgi:hypothetical protein
MSYVPKVGEKCEWKPFSPTQAKWKECKIDFIHGECFCITNYDSFMEKEVVLNVYFRPIKTEEEKQIDKMLDVVDGCNFHYDCCKALHEAGYRKVSS